jgi:SAM-dependent methyltransferase
MSTRLPTGNSAKRYCVQQLTRRVGDGAPFVLLDMGCGTARNFIEFLQDHPHVRYVGVDPHAPSIETARKLLAGVNAEIHHAPAERFTLPGGADGIVSFSVFEHVPSANRGSYLQAMQRNLRPRGVAYVNYDSGHFTTETTTRAHQTAIRALRQGLAQFFRNLLVDRFGMNVYYQKFVSEAEFLQGCAAAGLRIEQARSFNTGLKTIYRYVREDAREEFMQRWLDLELWIDEHARPFDDSQAAHFTTRGYVLTRQ